MTCERVANDLCEAAVNDVDAQCSLLLKTANPTVCFSTCGTQVTSAATVCASIVSYVPVLLTITTNLQL